MKEETDFGGPTSLKENIIRLIKRYDIVKEYSAPVRLSSGNHADVYIDLKKAAGIPVLFEYITALASKRLCKSENEQLIGIELFGAIYAHSIAGKSGMYCCSLKKKQNKYRKDKILEGYLPEHITSKNIILVDGVLTTGRPIINGLEKLDELEYSVKKAFVIFDKQEGGREELESRGISLESLFAKEELV